MNECRVCGNTLDITLVDLGTSPVANDFLTNDDLSQPEVWFPLKVMVCKMCWLAQTDYTNDPKTIFRNNYPYLSSTSSSWVQHASSHAEFLINQFNLNKQSFVLEIASNDGYLLENFVRYQIPCLGVEPTSYVANLAEARNVPTINKFYNIDTSKLVKSIYGDAEVIIANNVLAHVPNPCDLLKSINFGLSKNGVASVEFPHLIRLVQEAKFDTVYHEHYSYFSLTAILNLASMSGLRVLGADKLETHGGSLRVYFSKKESNKKLPFETKINSILKEEIELGINSREFYSTFQKKVFELKNELLMFILNAKSDGKRLAAYGAAAKGNTLLNSLGIKSDLVEYVVDKSKSKQGKFLPGSRIPVVSEDFLLQKIPHFLIVLPWNLEVEIINQLKYLKKYGVRFVIPLPKLKVID